MKESVSTTIKNVARAIRRFFMGEAYTVAACVPGYGTFTCTINAPDKRRALESAAAAGIRAIRMAADIDDPSAAAYAIERSIPTAKAFKDILDFIKPEE